jgi:hypothetical protein
VVTIEGATDEGTAMAKVIDAAMLEVSLMLDVVVMWVSGVVC